MYGAVNRRSIYFRTRERSESYGDLGDRMVRESKRTRIDDAGTATYNPATSRSPTTDIPCGSVAQNEYAWHAFGLDESDCRLSHCFAAFRRLRQDRRN
jgi:hypothetical protein